MSENLLEMVDIVKVFPGVVANDRVNFSLKAGEIHALLGENGAGKTTLMNILYGIYKMDSGVIKVDGREVSIRSPRNAIKLGIGMVHQNFKLVPAHTIVENVILGSEKNGFILDLKKSGEKIKNLASSFGLMVDPFSEVWKLSMGERQRVEILKLLYRNVRIMIFDEPTAVLTPQEKKELFSSLREMSSKGKSIIFITHKLDEVLEISDRVTVLRRGKNVATKVTKETNKVELANLMIGRPVIFEYSRYPPKLSGLALKVENIRVLDEDGNLRLKDVSFSLNSGEIVGVAGIAGNGQRELAEAITGLRRVSSGKIFVKDKDLTNASPRRFFENGVLFIPEERLGVGTAPNLSVAENLVLKSYNNRPFCDSVFLNFDSIQKFAERLVNDFEIVCPSVKVPVKLLSGGNLQKVVLARELSSLVGGDGRVIVAMYPTRGLDVGATEYVRRLLLKMRDQGNAIIFFSEDLEEILSISDRIFVMFDGRIVGEMDSGKADVEKIGLMMAGSAVS
ncbi:MAG: ABC transporter ATP-binding protein [Nitrososphaeria archaeon]|nr:ABC transporter ATP-binding protein [Nitrososphaeria archaeon]